MCFTQQEYNVPNENREYSSVSPSDDDGDYDQSMLDSGTGWAKASDDANSWMIMDAEYSLPVAGIIVQNGNDDCCYGNSVTTF